MRHWLLKAVILAAVTLVLVVAGAYVYARHSLPETSGTIVVDGPSAAIDIVRDRDAVPHIYAANEADALFGLGYVHAQDRLWQMEFQRRIGHGRLSEIFGAATIAQDRFLRTVGFGRAARSAWEHLTPEAVRTVNAYVAGINAFISTHHGASLPPEFTLLRFEPEPWTGPDVLVWGKMMAWDLSTNYAQELFRDDLARAVGDARMEQLMPRYADDGLSILKGPLVQALAPEHREAVNVPAAPAAEGALLASLTQGDPAVRDLLLGTGTTEGLGSNNWVVDGSRTASGKPLLANDPHLAAKIPSTWYLAHIVGGTLDVIGATLPGTPAVVIGRNRSIAWGVTNVGADVQDLYREQLDAGGTSVLFKGAAEPLSHVAETIIVKNGATIQVDVRSTRHGPLISDAINANNQANARGATAPPLPPLALKWTALEPEDTTLLAFTELGRAQDWTAFTAALRSFVVPSQNFVYADVKGHIGYYAPGRLPIRARGDGSRPVDGSTGDSEWTGVIPFDELPHALDPADHFIVTANQRPTGAGYPYNLGVEWPEAYRAKRITELLQTRALLTPADFAAIQADTVSLHARVVLPALLARARPDNDDDRRALQRLRVWNLDASAASPDAALFEAWFLHLAPIVVGDDLGPRLTDAYVGRYSVVTRFVLKAISNDDDSWCDDRRTDKKETCIDAVTEALHEAVGDLRQRLGNDMTNWRWDAVHPAVFPHQGLDAIGLLRPLLSRRLAHGGDWSTVNVGAVAADQPYEQHNVSGFREIVDLSDANDSRYLVDVGQSGHPLSPHYADFLLDWQAVRGRPMRMTRASAEDGALGRLRLTPRLGNRN